jgi:hypothetical protein
MAGPVLVTEWIGRGEAIVLAMVAGGLFVAEGFYLPYSTVALPFASVSLPAAGAISVAAGLAMVFLAALYRTYGQTRSSVGVVIVLIAAGGLWFGGGFWVGTFLGSVAGALIIVLPPYPRSHQPP